MAELSALWGTNDVGDGPAVGYSSNQLAQFFRLFTQGAYLSGVAPDRDNELAVSGTSSPVTVATGMAIVHGTFYVNTAAVTVAVPTPTVNPRIDRIVLRKSWSAQTVRVVRVAGTEGGAAPDPTMTDGTSWDLPLARVSINTAGVITVTDERTWLSVVGDGAVVTDKLAADAVTDAKLANMAEARIKGRAAGAGTGDPTDLTAAQVRSILNVADGANAYVHPNHSGEVTSTGDGATVIAAGAVGTTKLADDAVTDAKLANMAEARIKGRAAGAGTGDPTDLTAAQVRTMLGVAEGVLRQLVIPIYPATFRLAESAGFVQNFGYEVVDFAISGARVFFVLDKTLLPATCTVKLAWVGYPAPSGGRLDLRVRDIANGSVMGAWYDVAVSAFDYLYVSDDFAGSLIAGRRAYSIEYGRGASATADPRVWSFFLLIEW
jgi:hypothetical protein